MRPYKYSKLLIVDDSPDNIKIIIDLLQHEYTIYFAKSGPRALELAASVKPDIILLDIIMPEMDGYEVCKRLKQIKQTADIPVIFISAKNEVGDETRGLHLGAVDYITKPISPPILKARIKNHLKLSTAMYELKRLYSMALDASPLTGLPGNNSIATRIELALKKREKVCVIYSDLDNFKAFNDKYGFAKGDEVILFNSHVIREALSKEGIEDTFIGHIGGDDFVMTIPSDKVKKITEDIINRFDKGIRLFYNKEDREKNCISSLDRQGVPQIFPIMSISMAGVDLSSLLYTQYIQVNDACSGAKKKAKSISGSSFVMNLRKTTSVHYCSPETHHRESFSLQAKKSIRPS